MRKTFLLAFAAAGIVAVQTLPAAPAGNQVVSRESVLMRADGGELIPSCGSTPCPSGPSSTFVLADGGGPYPLCWPNQCVPQVADSTMQEWIAPARTWRAEDFSRPKS